MGCWDIVDIPPDTMLLGVRWVFKIKMIENECNRHKVRLVVKGYMQQQGVHYTQSFSPTISQVSLRIVMALTSMKGFRSWDLDATSAFVSAPLPEGETVYMEQIRRFPLPKGKCLKLKRTLYGLVQAPLAFYKLCCEVCISVGYRQLETEECIFVRFENNVSRKSTNCHYICLNNALVHWRSKIASILAMYRSRINQRGKLCSGFSLLSKVG
jgi:hypothetical protein